ncbi:uncharacterized protein B0I36DRAFT_317635 [Microdochium trichocladiopsis]|uniref:Uncharacterized protein n=1 Tax=Microdochium trichocladiopsis TaxID=1682393 RepID=A0A9P8YDL3_9PEZI|nr:uncharacterized protein B0I36DRAFT_317635 [Microdochium trichocladiopsis]KAH7035103.1 hypothetical protein B0I36DRAFT_317635 [Microdochium trichocladiopsis]
MAATQLAISRTVCRRHCRQQDSPNTPRVRRFLLGACPSLAGINIQYYFISHAPTFSFSDDKPGTRLAGRDISVAHITHHGLSPGFQLFSTGMGHSPGSPQECVRWFHSTMHEDIPGAAYTKRLHVRHRHGSRMKTRMPSAQHCVWRLTDLIPLLKRHCGVVKYASAFRRHVWQRNKTLSPWFRIVCAIWSVCIGLHAHIERTIGPVSRSHYNDCRGLIFHAWSSPSTAGSNWFVEFPSPSCISLDSLGEAASKPIPKRRQCRWLRDIYR